MEKNQNTIFYLAITLSMMIDISEPLLKEIILEENSILIKAISVLETSEIKTLLVIDKDKKIKGTVTDGDIRRGLLKDLELNSPINKVMNTSPVLADTENTSIEILELMSLNQINCIPCVNKNGEIIGLHSAKALSKKSYYKNTVLIMAGGFGKRLHPYTKDCPKPMLKVLGKPMLEHILEKAKKEGFNKFIFSVHYLSEIIKKYFEDGKNFDVEIEYIEEKEPLGTAGALTLIDPIPKDPLIVINGDVMSNIRFSELLKYHNKNKAIASMAVRQYSLQNPFGVIKTDGLNIISFEEKPVSTSFVNAGVYVLNPESINFLPANQPFDMPSLFEILRKKSFKTIAFPIHEAWSDIGNPADLADANDLLK